MGMNWWRVAAAAALPLLVAIPVVLVFWRRRQVTLGTVAGAAVFLVSALVFIGLDYAEGLRFRMWCEETATPCPPSRPSDFVRISVFGIVAMAQVMALFVAAAAAEARAERARYDPQWR